MQFFFKQNPLNFYLILFSQWLHFCEACCITLYFSERESRKSQLWKFKINCKKIMCFLKPISKGSMEMLGLETMALLHLKGNRSFSAAWKEFRGSWMGSLLRHIFDDWTIITFLQRKSSASAIQSCLDYMAGPNKSFLGKLFKFHKTAR